MSRFRQTTEIIKLMSKKEQIRNVGIIAHIDHGKTTMTDSLLAGVGLLSPKIAGKARVLDYLEEEQKRGITIKTANISLLHEVEGRPYVINLVDTPGHVDFAGKVTRALRVIDGAVVVVDAVEEIMAQTETVTRQALEERVKPVLFINKVDRLIKELKLSSVEIQEKLARIIRDFNILIEVYGEPEFKEKWKVDPQNETVAFGSALHRWGFTLKTAREKGIKFSDIIEAYKKEAGQDLSKMIPLHNAILDMVVRNVPSPIEAQKYRIPRIWKGNLNSEIGQAMKNCDDNGPTVMGITTVQMDPEAGLIATGRLFSGSVKEGDHVYLVNAAKDCKVQQVSMYMGAFRENVDQITAGNIAALSGLEGARAGETLVSSSHKGVMVPFEPIKYVLEPIITIAVEPKNPRELPSLIEAMKRLSIEDPNLVATINTETGEYLLSGLGELHLEIAAKFLKNYSGGIELLTSKPMVVYRESIAEKGATATAESPNKHNKLWVTVEPLEENVINLIEKGIISEETERKQMEKLLSREAGLPAEAQNVLVVEKHRNMLVDLTKNIQHLQDTVEAVIAGFKWACKAGPLCEEPLRGVKVKIVDAKIHENPVHRGPAQIMPAIRRAILGSFLTAKPVLLEPVYKIEVSVPTQWIGECSNIITRKRGKILSSEYKGTLAMIRGYIPVAETLGLAAEMRSATSGHAFWQCAFSHWEKVPEPIAVETVRQIRKRKGLPLEAPTPDKFMEKE
ncbi:MAG: elongation factor EF-2 [Candidatus Bathyarchaeales archaeon]